MSAYFLSDEALEALLERTESLAEAHTTVCAAGEKLGSALSPEVAEMLIELKGYYTSLLRSLTELQAWRATHPDTTMQVTYDTPYGEVPQQ